MFKIKNYFPLKELNGKIIKALKYMSQTRMKYTEPLDIQQILTVTSARKVPENIPRPIYVTKKNYQPGYKEKSIIKKPEELDKFREACRIAAGAVMRAVESVKEGCTTDDIDQVVHEYIVSQNAYPSAIGYLGFPKSVCTSVNEVVCHGIPNKRPLKKGDYLNIDVTAYFGGYHGDTSSMAFVGEVHPDIQKLSKVTREAMFKAISICKPGVKIRQIGEVIENYAKSHNYTVNREFCGHGVGKELHMIPLIKHDTQDNRSNEVMEEGMAFTIEPIIMMYPYDELYMWEDNWTVIGPDNPSAQWEHIVLITKDGCEVLTKRDNEELLL